MKILYLKFGVHWKQSVVDFSSISISIPQLEADLAVSDRRVTEGKSHDNKNYLT